MSDDEKFEEALEAVFEEHTSRFGPDLRELLKQLFLEGVKEGRARTLIETAQLEQRLDGLSNKSIIEEPPKDFAKFLDEVVAAADELGVKHSTRKTRNDELRLVLHQTIIKPDEGRSFDIQTRYGGYPGQEIHGVWMDDVASWTSPTTTSASSQASSIPETSNRSVTGSTIPDESVAPSKGTPTGSTFSRSGSTQTSRLPSRSSVTGSASGWGKKPKS